MSGSIFQANKVDWRLIAIINCVSLIALFCMTFLFGMGPTRENAILDVQEYEILAMTGIFISFLVAPMGIACVFVGLIMKPFVTLIKFCGGAVYE